jgi:hypothetical protein
MRAPLLAAVLLLGGCFSPSYRSDLACGPGGDCPPGFTCGGDNRCRSGDPITGEDGDGGIAGSDGGLAVDASPITADADLTAPDAPPGIPPPDAGSSPPDAGPGIPDAPPAGTDARPGSPDAPPPPPPPDAAPPPPPDAAPPPPPDAMLPTGTEAFTDPTGDATGAGLDIGVVTVRIDMHSELQMRIAVPSAPRSMLMASDQLMVFLDTDQALATGDRGYEYRIVLRGDASPAFSVEQFVDGGWSPTFAILDARLRDGEIELVLGGALVDNDGDGAFDFAIVSTDPASRTPSDVAPDGAPDQRWTYER